MSESKRPCLALHWQILLALLAGALVGLAINRFWTADTWKSLGVQDSAAYLKHQASEANAGAGTLAGAARFVQQFTGFVGDLFLRLLRFVAVPIVLFSLIVGVSSLGDIRKIGRIGGKTLALFIFTTVIAASIGLGISNAIKPGTHVSEAKRSELMASQASLAKARIEQGQKNKEEISAWKRVAEVVPLNPFESLAKADMLAVVFTSVVIGIGLTLVPRSKADPVVRVMDGLQDAMGAVLSMVMRLAPCAVFALIAATISQLGMDVLRALIVYCLVVVAGLLVALLGMYPALLWAMSKPGNRVGLPRFIEAMGPAMLLAFSSSSSNATLPVTMKCARERLGVSEDLVSFVCPLGATINMAGTALYQAVAATFIGQMFGLDLSLSQQFTIVVLATLIAVGTPGVPGGSIAMMVIVLDAIHVPATGIAVILGVDRILDMCRTVVNIAGDAAVAAMVASGEGKLAPRGEPGTPSEA